MMTIKLCLKWLIYVLPTVLLVGYMMYPFVKSAMGVYGFYQVERQALEMETDHSVIQTRTQQFFMSYGTNIDILDVINVEALRKNGYLKFAPHGCLENAVVAYVPFRMRLPYWGIKTFEYCLVIKS
ncbi:MAG: hypothetical protein OXC44_02410 [Proteobacteria bacterium]|nr:hypothetical protein [Pseudomonadota bacterium]